MQDQRALLDSLMGNDRNAGKKDGQRQNWWDEDICKKYLAWECPHDFFTNQKGRVAPKSPLGECPKQHLEALKQRFESDKDYDKHRKRYLFDLEKQLRRLVEDLDAKRDRDKEKLAKGEVGTKDAQAFVMTEIETRSTLVKDKLLAAEEMANSGEVEVSKTVYKEAMYLSGQRDRLERLKEETEGWIDEVCDVCGTVVSWRDPEEMRRLKAGRPHSHSCGVFHTGWQRMRDALVRVQEELEKLKDVDENSVSDPFVKRDRRERREDTKTRDRDSETGGTGGRRHADGRKDAAEMERRGEFDRGRRPENGYSSSGRDRDDRRYRDRDEKEYKGYRDRDGREYLEWSEPSRGRDRDGAQSRRLDRYDRRRREPVYDEFGRDISLVGKHRDSDYGDQRSADHRSRSRGSRERGTGRSLQNNVADCEDSENVKILRVKYSEDWEEVMGKGFEELGCDQLSWDMQAYDCRERKIDLSAEVVDINIDSFPLKFKFTRKA